MAETKVWSGTSSQVKNFWAFVSCILILPIPWAFWRWLQVKNHVYELTNERLLVTDGIFNKKTEALELYRIKDIQVTQPFFQRLFGLHTIQLISSDTSTPTVLIDYLPANLDLPSKLRQHVEECRMRKRVREIDFE